MNMLDAIAKDVTNPENLMQLLKLTHKQSYSRSSRLLNIGLIRRQNGAFIITSFGQLVHHSQSKIASAFKYSSELSVIDTLRSDSGMSGDQQKILIDKLIDDPEIKRLIT